MLEVEVVINARKCRLIEFCDDIGEALESVHRVDKSQERKCQNGQFETISALYSGESILRVQLPQQQSGSGELKKVSYSRATLAF